MAKHSDRKPLKIKAEPELTYSEAPVDANDSYDPSADEVIVTGATWIERPDWELNIVDNVAVIKGVSDSDVALLQQDDNGGFARKLVAWVASNHSGSQLIRRYEIQGKLWNIGTRGPLGDKAPYKMHPKKADRGSSSSAKPSSSTGAPVVDAGRNKATITTQDVVQFILAGKLSAETFREAVNEIREARTAQIAKLQAEIDGFQEWEKVLVGMKRAAE